MRSDENDDRVNRKADKNKRNVGKGAMEERTHTHAGNWSQYVCQPPMRRVPAKARCCR